LRRLLDGVQATCCRTLIKGIEKSDVLRLEALIAQYEKRRAGR